MVGEPRLKNEGTGRLVGRSREAAKADVAQLAERVLGKDEVTSSILVIGSSLRRDSRLRRTRRASESNSKVDDNDVSRT